MKKILLIAFMAILGTANVVTQTALPISGSQAKISNTGRYYVPQSAWNIFDDIYIDIVNSIEPEIGYEGWIGTNSWGAPTNSWLIGNTSAQQQQYVRIDVPGLWTNSHSGYGVKRLRIRRIADPILEIGSVSKKLSQWTFPQTVERGETAKLIMDEWFYTRGMSWIEKNGIHIAMQQEDYPLIGNGMTNFEMFSSDFVSANLIYSVSFDLYFEPVPVTGVALDQTQLTRVAYDPPVSLLATITPSDATNKDVSWESSEPSVATVSDVGVVNFVGIGTATITATTVDGGYTATCDVTVVSKSYSISLSSNNADWGTVSGEGTFDEGTPITVTATPSEGNSFLHWEEEGVEVSTQAEYSFTVNTDRDLLAVFQSGNSIDEIEAALKFFSYDGKVYIESPELIKEVSAYDVQGKLLKTMLLNSTTAAIGKFDPQILTIKIKIGKKTYAKKILVN